MKLFELIATAFLADSSQVITSDFLNSQIKMTRKQFYSNMYRLVNKTGLISKKRGHYSLSNYGKVVFHSLNIINRGSEYFWALKALDNTEMSSAGIPTEQMLEISARLIEDEDIRRIVFGSMMRDRPNKDVL
jgi:predicted transcriptional regulator